MTNATLRLHRRALSRRLPPTEVLAGLLLMGATLLAMVWANSPWGASYVGLWNYRLSLEIGEWGLSKPLVVWINDALMAVFFLLVGLEIKREFIRGSLSSPRKATLPLAAALGGMVIPALLYLLLNRGGPGASGWGVPMATDIAFALGLLAIVGRGAPVALKVLLAAVAIVDDLGAILVIAVAYTSDLATGALVWAAGITLLLVLTNRAGVRTPWPYVLLGVGLWYAVLKSGVHATLAGVLLAFTIPLGNPRHAASGPGLLERMEHALHPWVAFLIVPLFALANAGVPLRADSLGRLMEPVGLGIVLGLVLGKQAGILSFAWLAVRVRLAELPEGVTWRYLHGVAALCGIGFTMAIFIGNLAFADPALLEQAKTAILAASFGSALLAKALLTSAARSAAEAPEAVPTPGYEYEEKEAPPRRDEAA